MNKGRNLPWLAVRDLTDKQRSLYELITSGKRSVNRTTPLTDDYGRLFGPFNTLLHFPREGESIARRGEDLRFGTDIPPLLREIVILYVSRSIGAPYEWYAHVQIAQRLGAESETIQWLSQVRPDSPPPVDSAPETIRQIVACCKELLLHNQLGDDRIQYLESLFTGATIQLIQLVGYYQDLARILRTFNYRIPWDAEAKLLSDFEEEA